MAGQACRKPVFSRRRNTVYLKRVAHAPRGNGHAVDDALLHDLSPLGWEYIDLNAALEACALAKVFGNRAGLDSLQEAMAGGSSRKRKPTPVAAP